MTQPSGIDSNSPSALTVHVDLAERSYDIQICSNQLGAVGSSITDWLDNRLGTQTGQRKALIVTDRNVAAHANVVVHSLAEAGWNAELVKLEPGEKTKSLPVISGLYERMVEMNADRRTVVVAVGGGVIGDAAGFLAATYNRGVPFVQVPTTLLSDVDSSVGGKVGVNLAAAKNLIGSFYQPLGVFIDTSVLTTLPDRDYRSGLAEVVKYGVILDAEFFEFLEQNVAGINSREPSVLRHMIARSCQLKADVVKEDEYERTGLRAVLNYGHTFAHAFEALAGYGELLHGEAVAIGMLYASRLAEKRGLIDAELTARQKNLLEQIGSVIVLPDPSAYSVDQILSKMRLDKKTVGGELRFVLPTKLGNVTTFADVPEFDVSAVITECAAA
ncbi:MAG: 3-dehydroquinate synthase [Planctomycetota bacterium]|nr:3-dehydroquinate synthase [Planctomycetota bacterium]